MKLFASLLTVVLMSACAHHSPTGSAGGGCPHCQKAEQAKECAHCKSKAAGEKCDHGTKSAVAGEGCKGGCSH